MKPHNDFLFDNAIDANVLDRYLAREASADEIAQVERFLTSHPEHVELLDRLQKVSYTSGQHDDTLEVVDVAGQWKRVQAHIAGISRPQTTATRSQEHIKRSHDPENIPFKLGSPTSDPRSRFWIWATLGVMILVLSLTSVSAVILHSRYAASPEVPALVTYATAAGQRASIELTDGTRVVLNVGSRIRIPENFRTGTRTVFLDGEAYFQVVHAADRPFTVDAAGSKTVVLGTEFGVRAYDDSTAQIAVRSGKVAVNGVVADARDVVHVAHDGTVSVAHEQPLDMLGFVAGRLVLHDVPLRDAIPDLDRWYDADIKLGSYKLGDQSIHATLRSGTIGELINVLQLTFGARVVRNGRTITLYLDNS
jgi:ferric-dicitrate binding protein FerR (iron transport regulator)